MGEGLRTSIGARLKQERLRLGLSQTDFAAHGDASKRSVIEWEKGTLVPTAEFLALVGESLDVDVLFVVMGRPEAKAPGDALQRPALASQSPLVSSLARLTPDLRDTVQKLVDAILVGQAGAAQQ